MTDSSKPTVEELMERLRLMEAENASLRNKSQIAQSEKEQALKKLSESEQRAQELEVKAESLEAKAEGLEKKAESLEAKAEGLEKKAESLEAKAEDLEKKAERLEKKSEGLAKRAERLTKKAEKLTERSGALAEKVERLEKENEKAQNLASVSITCLGVLTELSKLLLKTGEDLLGIPDNELLKKLETVRVEMIEAVTHNQDRLTKLVAELYPAKGRSEKLPSAQKLREDFEKEQKTLSDQINKLNRQAQALSKAIAVNSKTVLRSSQEDEATRAMKQIAAVTPKKTEIGNKPLRGRQVKEPPCAPQAHRFGEKRSDTACPRCGSLMEPIAGYLAEKFRDCKSRCEENIKVLETTYSLWGCTAQKCGKVDVAIDENTPLPGLPNRTIGIDTLIEMAYWHANGIPVEKWTGGLKEIYQLGNSTMHYNLIDFEQIYLEPIVREILKKAREQEILLADETTFSVLESQGRGHQKKKTVGSECKPDAASQKEASESRIVTRSYLLGLSSAPSAADRFVYFDYMTGRSSADLTEIITKDYQFKVLVTDGYSGYNAVMQEHPNAMRQSCLIHMRREFIKILESKNLHDNLGKLSAEEFERLCAEQIKNNNPYSRVYSVLEAISKIYRIQDQRNQVDSAELLADQRKLMDCLDVLVKKLSEGRVSVLSTGRYKQLRTSDSIAAACVYYLNRRDELRVFLDNPLVPCDTNLIEQAIRPFAVLRKNVYYKQTIESTKAMCGIVTVFSTLENLKVG